MKYSNDKAINEESVLEDKQADYGFVYKSEEEKLLADIHRPYIEKLQLFTRMLRRNATLNKVIIQQRNL